MSCSEKIITLTQEDIVAFLEFARERDNIEQRLAEGTFTVLLAITSDDKLVAFFSGRNPPEDEYREPSEGQTYTEPTSQTTLLSASAPAEFSVTYSKCCCNSKGKVGVWLGKCCCGNNPC